MFQALLLDEGDGGVHQFELTLRLVPLPSGGAPVDRGLAAGSVRHRARMSGPRTSTTGVVAPTTECPGHQASLRGWKLGNATADERSCAGE
ncbi:hypothetical protein ADL34_06485 [Streptomyces sp. NRRL WC-3605]|nr:hypothetical protein ADL33_13640 [Streptomyces sp. NRRL WC-3604]KUL78852.1 hypothetical protein ADL34_06485 [Streptomyces sp. NRRL WC-3605]